MRTVEVLQARDRSQDRAHGRSGSEGIDWIRTSRGNGPGERRLRRRGDLRPRTCDVRSQTRQIHSGPGHFKLMSVENVQTRGNPNTDGGLQLVNSFPDCAPGAHGTSQALV